MDAVDITPYPGRPSTADTVTDSSAAAPHRRWKLTVRLEALRSHTHDVTLVDPFIDADYSAVFERYLRNTDQPPWSPQSLSVAGPATPVLVREGSTA